MRSTARFLFTAAPMIFLAADVGGTTGASAPVPPLDFGTDADGKPLAADQFAAGPSGKLSISDHLDAALTRIRSMSAHITALGKERDEAVRLAKTPTEQAARIMAENPSTAARAILSLSGGPSVPSQPHGAEHPGNTGKSAATNLAGKSPLQRAVAKSQAGGFKKA